MRLLESLTATDYLAPDDAAFLKQAYCGYRDRVHRAALQEIPPRLPAAEFQESRARVQRIWRGLMGE